MAWLRDWSSVMTEMLWAEMAALPPARSTALHILNKVVETA